MAKVSDFSDVSRKICMLLDNSIVYNLVPENKDTRQTKPQTLN